jgi:hypothetical protein
MKRNAGVYLIHTAAAVYLLADGILGFITRNGRIFGRLEYHSEIEGILLKLLGRGDFTTALIVIFSVLAVTAGLFLLLELFQFRAPFTETVLLLFLLLWGAFIILTDLVGPFREKPELLGWLKLLAAHLMVLGTLIAAFRRINV